jgi:hypothetical protein
MHIKVKNNIIDKYPYSIRQLMLDNLNTSFPAEMPNERLAEWDVYPVISTTQPEPVEGKELAEDTPVFDGEKWLQVWKLI